MWSPIDGPPIRLWKANPNNSPKLPTRVPSLVLYRPIWGNFEVSGKIKVYKFWTIQIHGFLEGWHCAKFHI
jgi:hypothetical protein